MRRSSEKLRRTGLTGPGRVIVNEDLTVPGHPEVQVIGDFGEFFTHQTGEPLPGISPVRCNRGVTPRRTYLRDDKRA